MEVFQTLGRHRFRTGLTAISVAWGILMLVLLLGSGNGLEGYITHQFRDDAVNSIWVYPGVTTMPHEGLGVGRPIRFTDEEFDLIGRRVEGVEYITGRYRMFGEMATSYRDKHSSFDVRATHADHRYLEKTIMERGRFLNDSDIAQRRKVAVIGREVADFLFGDADPMGEWIQVRQIPFQVVGIFTDEGGPGEQRKIYLPITTARAVSGGGLSINQIMFTLPEGTGVEASHQATARVRALLSETLHFHPDDDRALRVRNNIEQYGEILEVLDLVVLFVLLVGLGTITAGVVGVGNIMLVSVAERTSEFGLRKAVGATPFDIVATVLAEAVILTSLSGYVGLVLGIGLLEVAGRVSGPDGFLRDPQVDLGVAAGAVVLLVVCGALAGLWPAWRAASVQPVVALRNE